MLSDKRWEVVVTVMGTILAGLIGYLAMGTYQLSAELVTVREKLTEAVTRLERVDDLTVRMTNLESRQGATEQRVAAMEGRKP